MDVNFVLLLCIALIFAADTKVYGEAEVITNSNLTDARFGGSEVVTDHSNNKTSLDTQLGDRSKPNKDIDEDSSKIEGMGGSDESESTKKEEAMSKSSSRKKEGSHGEECDPSNMCTDEQSQFVACLRVPGNDAPHLSLLIQNKAKGALIVSITGPRFFRLDKNKVELLENQDTKVKVYSIKNKKGGSNGRSIILTSTTGRCSLELKDLAAAHETVNHDTIVVSRPTILNIGRFFLPTLSLTKLHYGHFQSFSVVC